MGEEFSGITFLLRAQKASHTYPMGSPRGLETRLRGEGSPCPGAGSQAPPRSLGAGTVLSPFPRRGLPPSRPGACSPPATPLHSPTPATMGLRDSRCSQCEQCSLGSRPHAEPQPQRLSPCLIHRCSSGASYQCWMSPALVSPSALQLPELQGCWVVIT